MYHPASASQYLTCLLHVFSSLLVGLLNSYSQCTTNRYATYGETLKVLDIIHSKPFSLCVNLTYILNSNKRSTQISFKPVTIEIASRCVLLTTLFMLSLFLTQCLNRWTDHWYLRWYCRLRPFYEAFTGPCRNNYRFWPGFLYIVRSGLCCLTVNISANQQHHTRLRMVATCFTCVLVMLLACIFPHGVYKKWPLNVLEFSFFLNLCITSALLSNGRHYSVIFLSVPLAMLTCVGILLYHTYQQCKSTHGWKTLTKYSHKMYTYKRKYYSTSNDMGEERVPLLPQPLPPVVQFKDFRESLLED